jgi:hypothetical protein
MSLHRVNARLLLLFQLPLLGCLLPLPVAATARRPQTPEAPLLRLNRPLAGTLMGAESHAYKLRLEAGAFARVLVTQRGVDVFVRALDAQRGRVAQANDSFGRTGPQPLEFVAEAGGDYLIEVTALKDESGGGYEIEFLESRRATHEDRTRAAANDHVSAGNGLRSKATAEANALALVEYEKALALYRRLGDRGVPLSPGALRDGGEMARLTLPRGARAVLRLQLALESDEPGTYEAALLTAEGLRVSGARGLKARRSGPDVVVSFDVPARLLRAADYQVKLSRRTGGRTESAGLYYFRALP